jgi:hypothetical protein
LGDTAVLGKIILRFMLRIQSKMIGTALNWLRVRSSRRILYTRLRTTGFHKNIWENFLPD